MMSGLLVLSLAIAHWGIPDVLASAGFGVNRGIVPDEIAIATANEDSLIDLTRTLLNYFLGFLGILALAIVIYGGFMYVTAGVNDSGAETGKKVLTYAAIGIIVILLSFVIVNTLLQSAVPGAVQ
jgi:hypothetical protein